MLLPEPAMTTVFGPVIDTARPYLGVRLLAVLATVTLAGAGTTSAVAGPKPPPGGTGTVAQWTMSESTTATTMVDSSPNHNDGVISTRVLRAQPGFRGFGYGFAGDGGRVTVPDSVSLNPEDKAYSVSLYFKSSVKPTSSVGDYDLIRKGLASTPGGDWKIEVLRNGHAFCHFRGSSGSVSLTGTSNVVTGGWHSIACSTSSTGTQLVVDGKTQASTSKRPGKVKNTASLLVGAKNSTEDLTTGTIDEITITKG